MGCGDQTQQNLICRSAGIRWSGEGVEGGGIATDISLRCSEEVEENRGQRPEDGNQKDSNQKDRRKKFKKTICK